MTSTAIAPDVAPTERLARETIVLQFELKAPSFSVRVRSQDIMDETQGVDPNLIHAKKDLIDRSAPTLRAIHVAASQFKGWLHARTLPAHLLKGGMMLVPFSKLVEVDTAIAQFKRERAALVEKLVAEFDQYKAEAAVRLCQQFDEREYPEPAALADKFGVTARFWTFDVPAAMRSVNRALWEREQQRVQADWQDTAEYVRGALREGFAQLVEHFAERLTPDADGKPKTFRESTVKNLQEFLATFNDRNLTDDARLGELVAQAKALLSGVTPQNLRKQETTRERVLQGFDLIRATLAPIVKGRKFTFEEEGVA